MNKQAVKLGLMSLSVYSNINNPFFMLNYINITKDDGT